MNTKNLVLKLAVSIGAFILIAYLVDLGKVAEIIVKFSPFYIVLFFIVFAIAMMLGAVNIRVLLAPLKIFVPVKKLVKYSFLTYSLSSITPGRLGELAMIYFLKKERVRIPEGSGVFLTDKAISVAAVGLVGAAGLFKLFGMTIAIEFLLIMLIPIILFIFLMFSKNLRNFFAGIIPSKHLDSVKRLYSVLKMYITKHKKAAAVNFLITILKLMGSNFCIFIIFYALYPKIGFVDVFLISSIISAITMLPVTISGLGLREVSAVFFYGLIGVPAEITLAVHLIYLALRYVIVAASLMFLEKSDFTYLASAIKFPMAR